MMSQLHSTKAEDMCKELAIAFQGILSWKWDDRFQVVLAEFNIDRKADIHEILTHRLDKIWDISNIENAPAIVKTIVSSFGGFTPEQLLFTSDPACDALVFCAWWPWGNGQTISIRLAPFYQKPADADRTVPMQQLKSHFKISDQV